MSTDGGAGTVVVGGGVLGATTFYELARRGEPTLLFEASAFGCESTGKSAAIIRMHYSNPQVVQMAMRSRDAFARLPQTNGGDPAYYPCGWLFLVDDEEAKHARANVAMQRALGLECLELDPADLASYMSNMSIDGVAYAVFEPASGFADPLAVTSAYINAGCSHGGHAQASAPVERILTEQGRVVGVVVRGERVECKRVVLAAGAWSKKLASEVGVEIPMQFTREQDIVYSTQNTTVPCVISDQTGRIYLRPGTELGEQRLLAGRGFPKPYEYVDPDGYDLTIDRDFDGDLRERLKRRLPSLEISAVIDGRVGLYSITPDWHPIIGPVAAVEGLYLATGGSGHSFKLAPAIGEMLASEILDEPLDYADIEDFRLDRFERGDVFTSTYGGNRA